MYAEAETNGVLFQGNDAILRTVGVMQPGIQVRGVVQICLLIVLALAMYS